MLWFCYISSTSSSFGHCPLRLVGCWPLSLAVVLANMHASRRAPNNDQDTAEQRNEKRRLIVVDELGGLLAVKADAPGSSARGTRLLAQCAGR